MTELRTAFRHADPGRLSALIASVLKQINPSLQLYTEVYDRVMLIRIRFALPGELTAFMTAVEQQGLPIRQWRTFEMVE